MSGTRAGRYEIVRPLAMGGMAELLVARLPGTSGFDKEVVLKRLLPHYADDARVVQMFLDEARIAGSLAHPNLAAVLDAGMQDDAPFIVTERIEGIDLAALCVRGLESGRFLSLGHACSIVMEIADALSYVHAAVDEAGQPRRIVHRDVSPSNVLVGFDGHARLVDFGVARDEKSRSYADGVAPGKYSYMSPEQVRGEPADARGDLFSLGILLYEISVGRRLFKGRPEEAMVKIVEGSITPPTFIRRDFPPHLEEIVLRALERDPRDRYQDAGALRDALCQFCDDAGLRARPWHVAAYLRELDAPAAGAAAGGSEEQRHAASEFAGAEESLELDRGRLRLPNPEDAKALEKLAEAAAREEDPGEGERIGAAMMAALAPAGPAVEQAGASGDAGEPAAAPSSPVAPASAGTQAGDPRRP